MLKKLITIALLSLTIISCTKHIGATMPYPKKYYLCRGHNNMTQHEFAGISTQSEYAAAQNARANCYNETYYRTYCRISDCYFEDFSQNHQ